ncbi:MAG: DUF1413 domain-containing protein [Oscillospiraceae bacterium]
MDTNAWMEKARRKIEELPNGRQFELKALFEIVEWETLTKGDRISFGKYFSNEVKEGNIPNVVKLERAKNNHSKYQKQEKK